MDELFQPRTLIPSLGLSVSLWYRTKHGSALPFRTEGSESVAVFIDPCGRAQWVPGSVFLPSHYCLPLAPFAFVKEAGGEEVGVLICKCLNFVLLCFLRVSRPMKVFYICHNSDTVLSELVGPVWTVAYGARYGTHTTCIRSGIPLSHKKKETLPFVTIIWMDFEGIVLNELSQRKI